jgi:hypothetical protein
MKSSSVIISKFYIVRILLLRYSTASLIVWSRHLILKEKILGSNPIETTGFYFLIKRSIHVFLHFYLPQPGIIKIFLLCNIPGKVPQFFLYKQDIKRVNCMQNVTKYMYYILLRNVASVLKYAFCFPISTMH